ncbi:hypothetical protein M673_15865 [Aureimonas sp. AU20]|nr:hypothetical protein M673_15865 [Aureimonas sp. AU20]
MTFPFDKARRIANMTSHSVEEDRVISHNKPMGPKLRIAIGVFLLVLLTAMISTLVIGGPTADPATAKISLQQQGTIPTNPGATPNGSPSANP